MENNIICKLKWTIQQQQLQIRRHQPNQHDSKQREEDGDDDGDDGEDDGEDGGSS